MRILCGNQGQTYCFEAALLCLGMLMVYVLAGALLAGVWR